MAALLAGPHEGINRERPVDHRHAARRERRAHRCLKNYGTSRGRQGGRELSGGTEGRIMGGIFHPAPLLPDAAMYRGARTSRAIPENDTGFCARWVRMRQDADLRTTQSAHAG